MLGNFATFDSGQFYKEEVAMTSTAEGLQRRKLQTISSLQELGVFRRKYRNLLLAMHESFNGTGCLYTPDFKFLSAPCYPNPRSNSAILESLSDLAAETKIRFYLNNNRSSVVFHAVVTMAVKIAAYEWLLALDGEMTRVSANDHEDPLRVQLACYFDTCRVEGFALLPLLTRDLLFLD